MKTLVQTVQECAKKIKSRPVPLILYAASAFCGRVTRAFMNAGVKPVCICDADANKHGREYYGLKVLSPQDAAQKYPESVFFITSYFHAPSITGHLSSQLKIPAERIFNYEPVEWRKSCPYLETALYVCTGFSAIVDCCKDEIPGRPFFQITGSFDEFIEKQLQRKNNLISDLCAGTSDSPCANCMFLKEGYYYKSRKVRALMHSDGGGCNFRCKYCRNSAKRPVKPDPISFGDFLSALKSKNVLAEDIKLTLGAGEFTIHPERNSLYELCDYAEYILTNGSIFDENVGRILRNGNMALLISIDAGTAETFREIKGVDCYQEVIKNIRKYMDKNPGAVHLKYVFLPGVNDNAENVDGFIELCSSIRTDFAVISYDHYSKLAETSGHTLKMIKRMADGLDKNGILWTDYAGLTKTKRYGELTMSVV